jgi:ribosomal-protein-alanine N-acetyltransferase
MSYANIFESLDFLDGDSVYLKPVSSGMAEQLFDATKESTKELCQYMPWTNESIDDARKFLEDAAKKIHEGRELHCAIFERQTNHIIGVIGLFHLDTFTPKAEVGYWIRSSCHGKGYATDALNTLINYCRNEMKLVRVDAQVATDNIASQRVVEKCGFQKEGLKSMGQLCHGTWQDMILYGILLVDSC